MKKRKYNWGYMEAKYGPGKVILYCGKVRIGSVFYDGTTSRDDKLKYRIFCGLPMTKDQENKLTQEEAQETLLRMAEHWFKACEENR